MLGIAGCSGSGKTTLAAELARTLGGIHFHLDNYYLDLGHLPPRRAPPPELRRPGADREPAARRATSRRSRAAKPSSARVYDFSTYTRVPGRTETVQRRRRSSSSRGSSRSTTPSCCRYYQLRVYIDTPERLCFERRLKRDIEQRGRTAESVRRQYEATVRPASVAYVRPSAANADLIVDGTGALDWKVERVMSELRHRGLLQAIREAR